MKKSRIKAWALDEKSQHRQRVDIRPSGTNTLIEIDPAFRTLWYGAEVSAHQ
jgi:hypothetical protein